MYLYEVVFEKYSSNIVEDYSSFVVSDSAKSAVEIVEKEKDELDRVKDVIEKQKIHYIDD
jgi:prefoldin subunit 5